MKFNATEITQVQVMSVVWGHTLLHLQRDYQNRVQRRRHNDILLSNLRQCNVKKTAIISDWELEPGHTNSPVTWPDPTRVNRKMYPLCNNEFRLLISANVEASHYKFGSQLGFAE